MTDDTLPSPSIHDMKQQMAHTHHSLRMAMQEIRMNPEAIPAPLAPKEYWLDASSRGTFSHDWFTGNIPRLFGALLESERRFTRYLEIGSFEGLSACWMGRYLATQNVPFAMTAIDPFCGSIEHSPELRSNLERRFDANINALLPDIPVRKMKMTSASALSKLQEQGEQFDLIYVDGSHDAIVVLSDAALSWSMLEPGGVIIFDDYFWTNPKVPRTVLHAVNAFLDMLGGGYTVLAAYYQVVLQKQ